MNYYKNNAFSVLASSASAGAPTLTLSAGTGARFPAGNFLATLIGYDGSGNENSWEIVRCTARAGDILTVVRAQEGTTAAAWPAAARIENRVTAGAMEEQQTALNLKANLAGPQFTGLVAAQSSPESVGISALAGANPGFESMAQGSAGTAGAATIAFHRPSSHAVHFGLDTDNKLKVGGWSLGANAYAIYHENNKPTKADVGLANVDNTSDASKPVSTAQQTALNLKAPLATPTITGLRETRVAMAAKNIDLSAGNVFTKTISGATTFTVSNVPAAGVVSSFILKLTDGGSAVVAWWAGVKWQGGTPPALTVSGRDNLYFESDDGGTTWDGSFLKDMK